MFVLHKYLDIDIIQDNDFPVPPEEMPLLLNCISNLLLIVLSNLWETCSKQIDIDFHSILVLNINLRFTELLCNI